MVLGLDGAHQIQMVVLEVQVVAVQLQAVQPVQELQVKDLMVVPVLLKVAAEVVVQVL
jgi:hypothetical protein